MQKKLRVGFDLDGVLLYNPARIARPLVTFIKQSLFHAKETKFFIPSTPLQNLIWRIFHYSSLFPNYGIKDIKKLVKKGKIEAYIISGRYAFLSRDFDVWVKRLGAEQFTVKAVLNEKNQQPFLFKQEAIRKLKLDVFVEDNWDVVKKLQNNGVKVFWLYNILDRTIEYKYKFPTLKKAVRYIEENLL